ncbi:MAG: hypothetical protein GX817_03240 [Elusimicrobia bacterium]|nr:hypothetical protein [Elusimicrobiota bacterium]
MIRNRTFIFIFLVVFVLAGKSLAMSIPVNSPTVGSLSLSGCGVSLGGPHISAAVNPSSLALQPYTGFSVFYGLEKHNINRGRAEFIFPLLPWFATGAATEVLYSDMSNYLQNHSISLSLNFFNRLCLGASGRAVITTEADVSDEYLALDAGIMLPLTRWLNIGAAAYNVNQPERGGKSLPMGLRGGITLYKDKYFALAFEGRIEDMLDDFDVEDIHYSYGIELFPSSAISLRGGIFEDTWTAGAGIFSGPIDFEYAYVYDEDFKGHYFQYRRKFGVPISRREVELSNRVANVEKDDLYLSAVRRFKNEDISTARAIVDEYSSLYGRDERIEGLEADINDWVERMRVLNLGRAQILKKEILRDFYAGRIKQARISLENAKILAPYFEDLNYLEHLIKARELLEEGEYIRAETHLVEALKINPDSSDVKNLYKRLQEVIKLSDE